MIVKPSALRRRWSPESGCLYTHPSPRFATEPIRWRRAPVNVPILHLKRISCGLRSFRVGSGPCSFLETVILSLKPFSNSGAQPMVVMYVTFTSVGVLLLPIPMKALPFKEPITAPL